MIQQEELEKLLIQSESAWLEKTVSRTNFDKFGEAICAFSNDLSNFRKAGYLVIGVTDDGEVDGQGITEKLVQAILDYRTNGTILPTPIIKTNIFSLQKGDVLVVEVDPHYLTPVRYKGKVCVRIGPRKGTSNEAEERILSQKRSVHARTYDMQPCRGSSLDDLSLSIFKTNYLPLAIDSETLKENGRLVETQLASLKFYNLTEGCPTILGILMFGKSPSYYIPGAEVQYVKFDGTSLTDNFVFEKRFTGNLYSQYESLNLFINNNVVKSVLSEIGGKYNYNYPASAIKELLYNAMIHRDYGSNAAIKFYEFSDRIEIVNPGGLYGNCSIENFPDVNDYRNPGIAEATKNLGYINTFNVGVKRAKEALEKNGNPLPQFLIDSPFSFSVKIYL